MHMFPIHLFSLARHFWVLTLANLQCTSVGPWESSTGSSFDRGSSATPRDEVELCHLFPTLPHCIDLPVCEGDFEWTILPLKNQVTVRAGMPAVFTIRLTCSPSKHALPAGSQYCPYPPCQLTLLQYSFHFLACLKSSHSRCCRQNINITANTTWLSLSAISVNPTVAFFLCSHLGLMCHL